VVTLPLTYVVRRILLSKQTKIECIPIPGGLPVSVSYQPSSVGIFGMVFGIKGGLTQQVTTLQIVYEAPILGVYSPLFYINNV
jgi:hypothetical protein